MVEVDTCKLRGKLRGKKPPPGKCNKGHDSDCCQEGKFYNKCMNYINIHGNGKTVKVKVIDEYDSTMGCDDEHNYQPPCANNIVDVSDAVWNALGVYGDKRGGMEIYWFDA
ncbi:hypothetical protein J1N35_026009 [Gossypium stocksii]|uniref:Ripening-related protein 1 n=1 Tax=Gossypium stocksii TaxID=47602 RepID=A0A9D3ZY89_9ROSI|nr:hypothetical protein J1N35_026009 [Gossypium stocksii]